jgi:hypothetical protein
MAKAQWSGQVLAGVVECGRCGELIQQGEDWHLDHLENGLLHPSHAYCNLVAAASTTNRLGREAEDWKDRRSRVW